MSYAIGPNVLGSYQALVCAVIKIAVRDAKNGDASAVDWLYTVGSEWIDILGVNRQMYERQLSMLRKE